MNGQNEREIQKNEDDDFDFFKKPKNLNLQKNENKVQLEKTNPSSNVIHENVSHNSSFLDLHGKSIFFFLGTISFFILIVSMMLKKDMNNVQHVYVIPKNEKTINPPIETKPINNSQEPFNVDYSKLNKNDAERVKKVVDQFKDIQKNLIETNNTQK
jgi:hypothetical protein